MKQTPTDCKKGIDIHMFHLIKKKCRNLMAGIFWLCGMLCLLGAGPVEQISEKEYAFFAESYEEAQHIADSYGAQLLYYNEGVGSIKIAQEVCAPGEEAMYRTAAFSPEEEPKALLYEEQYYTVEVLEVQTDELAQWHLEMLEAPAAWEKSQGEGVKIAVIDSGIDTDHEDLMGRIAVSDVTVPETEYDINGRFSGLDYTGEDHLGHGTHVSGIIAAENNGYGCTGIAPGSSIYSIKALEKEGNKGVGKTSWVVAAFKKAIAQNVDLINASIGGSKVKDPMLAEVIRQANAAGIPVVCAAGNITGDPITYYPAAYEETIAVSALQKSGTDVCFAYSYSNYGDWIDISAPGSAIMSTVPGSYGIKSGTSMACPMVTGSLALLMSYAPELSMEEYKNILFSSVTDLGPTGKDAEYGYGALNCRRLLERYDEEYKIPVPEFIFPDQSTIGDGYPIPLCIPENVEQIRYTIDGTIPTMESACYDEGGIIILDRSGIIQITARCQTKEGLMGKSVSKTYQIIPAVIEGEKTEMRTEEQLPDYGPAIDANRQLPSRSYQVTLLPGEKITATLQSVNAPMLLAAVRMPDEKVLAEAGCETGQNAQVSYWNKSKTSVTIQMRSICTAPMESVRKITYHMDWNTEQKELPSVTEPSQEEDQKVEQPAENPDNASSKEVPQTVPEPIKESGSADQKTEFIQQAHEEDEKKIETEEEIQFPGDEEDMLYTMEEPETLEQNVTESEKELQGTQPQEQTKDEVPDKQPSSVGDALSSWVWIPMIFMTIIFLFLILLWRKRKKDQGEK